MYLHIHICTLLYLYHHCQFRFRWDLSVSHPYTVVFGRLGRVQYTSANFLLCNRISRPYTVVGRLRFQCTLRLTDTIYKNKILGMIVYQLQNLTNSFDDSRTEGFDLGKCYLQNVMGIALKKVERCYTSYIILSEVPKGYFILQLFTLCT